MPKMLYCWRCRVDVPMLDEHEWPQLNEHLSAGLRKFKDYRREHGVGLSEVPLQSVYADALSHYEKLTGFQETNPNALWHHRISLYGPPCKACGKPLRTPRASFCAACGTPRT